MNHEAPSHNRLLALIIILALLLHMIMMMVFMLNDQSHPLQCNPDTIQNHPVSKHTDEQQFANRKAAQSQFGAPVIFQDEPEASVQPESQQEPASEQEENKYEQSQEPIPESQEQSLEKDTTPASINDSPQEHEQARDTHTTKPLTSSHTIQENTLSEPASSSKQNNSTHNAQKAQPKKKILRRTKTQVIEKNNFNLSKLAQGFLDYARSTGDSLVEVRGGHDGPPTDEQLKHERYWQKLAWCIQKTSKMYQDHYKKIPFIHTQTAWQMLLNRDGTIAHMVLVQSSGIQALDSLLQKVIQEASSAFPPVPAYFTGPYYKLQFVLLFEPYQEQPFKFGTRSHKH